MFRVLGLLGVFSLWGLAASLPVREVTSEANIEEGRLIPAFYHGYIYWIGLDGGENTIRIYAPGGHLAFALASENGSVQSLAIDRDGTMALAWWSPQKSGGIEFRNSYGQLTRTIQTGRFVPSDIAFDEDHALWVFGSQRDAANGDRPEKQDYMTVRKCLPDGNLAGAYLPRSLFPAGLEPAIPGWQWRTIFVARDRVGIWACSGDTSSKNEWVELDLNGKLLGRWRLDRHLTADRIALTRDGHLFVQCPYEKAKGRQLYVFNRDASAWCLVEDPPAGQLEGADDDTLAFSDLGLGPMHIRWYPLPASSENAATVLLK